MLSIASVLHIDTVALIGPENQTPDLAALDLALKTDPGITHIAVVHCETTTGILNPIEAIGEIVHRHGRVYFIDAMSSFAAYPIQLQSLGVDYLVSSANKCIEGVPGFSFILARKETLLKIEGYARSLSLDLLAQYRGLETDGQFRFTPPTHALLAFRQALLELEAEGGIAARGGRYARNYQVTVSGLEKLGFQAYLPPELRSYIITSFYYPDHPNFEFKRFYGLLSEKDQVIYPGKLSHADCFRVGHIGRLHPADGRALVAAVQQVMVEMDLPVMLPPRLS
jgi:2-aminoethylphosphonate-pyruvate transaminase